MLELKRFSYPSTQAEKIMSVVCIHPIHSIHQTIPLFLDHLEVKMQGRFICCKTTATHSLQRLFCVTAFTAEFLLCDITWYFQAKKRIPNLAYLFSGMLSCIMFYCCLGFLLFWYTSMEMACYCSFLDCFLILTQSKRNSGHL